MADFPSTLPRPLLSDYSVQVETAVTRIRFENGNTRLRRGTARHKLSFTLSFVFTIQQLWVWQSWANRWGYDWHGMPLQSPFSGQSVSLDVIRHTIRYTSDITYQAIGTGLVRASVSAELDVNTIPQAPVATSESAIVAGTPSSPALNVTTGGTPSSVS